MKRTIIIKDAATTQPGRSRTIRAALTLACALAADGLQLAIPPLWWACDGAMVIALLILWGWRWEILVVVIPELIPGLDLFPTWTLFAGYIIVGRGKNAPPPRRK